MNRDDLLIYDEPFYEADDVVDPCALMANELERNGFEDFAEQLRAGNVSVIPALQDEAAARALTDPDAMETVQTCLEDLTSTLWSERGIDPGLHSEYALYSPYEPNKLARVVLHGDGSPATSLEPELVVLETYGDGCPIVGTPLDTTAAGKPIICVPVLDPRVSYVRPWQPTYVDAVQTKADHLPTATNAVRLQIEGGRYCGNNATLVIDRGVFYVDGYQGVAALPILWPEYERHSWQDDEPARAVDRAVWIPQELRDRLSAHMNGSDAEASTALLCEFADLLGLEYDWQED